jgi:hemoglobin-like flavoprotein
MQMKKTAVEWLEKNISKYISYHYDKAYEENDEVTKIFEQALEMEKEQMVDFVIKWMGEDDLKDDIIKHYNETYNKQ